MSAHLALDVRFPVSPLTARVATSQSLRHAPSCATREYRIYSEKGFEPSHARNESSICLASIDIYCQENYHWGLACRIPSDGAP